MLRIIAGELKGRRLNVPKGEGTRPTSDRVRESLVSSVLSMLGDLDEVDVLDAFAGTGAFGLEMLSRGVGSCTFFENDRRALGVLRSNIELCGIDRGRFQVVSRDVFKAFSGADSPRAYRLVFLDPPYACTPQDVFTLLDNMRRCGALVGDSLILYEHALTASEEVRASAGSFAIEDIRRFGKTAVAVIHGGEM